MDLVTQMLFGATVAQAGFSKTLGRRALVAGAVLGALPDADVIIGMVAGPFAGWEYHRGFTHSLLFGPLVGPLIGNFIWKCGQRHKGAVTAYHSENRSRWMWLSALVLFTHPLIDAFTSYGTQLLWPLTAERFAINALSIIDPLYSLVLVFALLIGSFSRFSKAIAPFTASMALLFVVLYSLGGWAMNNHIERVAERQLGTYAKIEAFPLLLQPYFRRVLVETDDTIKIGYYSTLNPKTIEWTNYAIEPITPAIQLVAHTDEGKLFQWFSGEHYYWRTTLLENGNIRVEGFDTRYGMKGDTNLGSWGISAEVTADNQLVAPVERMGILRRPTQNVFSEFWRDLTGRP